MATLSDAFHVQLFWLLLLPLIYCTTPLFISRPPVVPSSSSSSSYSSPSSSSSSRSNSISSTPCPSSPVTAPEEPPYTPNSTSFSNASSPFKKQQRTPIKIKLETFVIKKTRRSRHPSLGTASSFSHQSLPSSSSSPLLPLPLPPPPPPPPFALHASASSPVFIERPPPPPPPTGSSDIVVQKGPDLTRTATMDAESQTTTSTEYASSFSHLNLSRRSSFQSAATPTHQKLQQTPRMSLAGKSALVTGGSRGIGAAIAVKLAQEGANVAITFLDFSDLQEAYKIMGSIEAKGSSTTAIQADATKDADKAVAYALKAFKVDELDIVVNSAESSADVSLQPGDYDQIFDAHTRTVFSMTQAAKDYLSPHDGRIINIGAMETAATSLDRGAEKKGDKMALAGSKAAVEAFTRVAALELEELDRGATVNCVAPGLVRFDEPEFDGSEDDFAVGKTVITGGRKACSVEDVAEVVAFLASPGAKGITGAVIPVKGSLRI